MFKRLFLALILALPLAAKAQDSPPHYSHSQASVAKIFGVDAATARAVRDHNLDEFLGWAVMLMAARCHCPVSTLIERRKTMSWGEVAQSTGWEWGKLMDEVMARYHRAGIHPDSPNEEQRRRSGANHPENLPAWKRPSP